jgi:uncharacterized protein (DUF1697 family)
MLPMKDLAAIFADLGCSNVRTYIQSGNVVFEASAKTAAHIPQAVAAAIEERFEHRVPVVVRSASEITRALEGNPFRARDVPTNEVYVAFLADKPTKARVAALDPARSAPDSFEVVGREIYLHFPNGGGRSKLTNEYFDRALATTSTIRNWRTVEQLASMLAS